MRLAIFVLVSASLWAQTHRNVPRSDGHSTPLLIYAASGSTTACAPLALISHGAGGSENGYKYLAQALSRDGYTVAVMGHRESGLDALSHDMRQSGFRQGLVQLISNPQAEQARLLDIGAALQWTDSQCKAPFRVLLGHSMGAITVMLEAGAKNKIGITYPPAGQDRFDAYVALSPEGPDPVFSRDAWSGIHKPLLAMTGTRDGGLAGGVEWRTMAWNNLPGTNINCQWLGVITDATHMNFAGNGQGAARVGPIVVSTVGKFLKDVRQGACTLPSPVPDLQLKAK